MSTAHLSLDDFAFPPHRPHSAYELSYALGQPQSSSLYPHSQHLEISPLAAQAPRQHHPLSTSDASHPLYLPEHPEAYLNPYGSGIAYPYLDSHLPSYALNHRPASPQAIYTANSAWGAPETYGGAPFEAAGPSSSSFLHSLQNVIESSHTSQVQQSINAAQAAAASQRPTTPSSSWTLSGSLDPATGVFQRSVEHPRLRTAQACEKCRIRKAKCSGDHPACQRCISRGLQCEYAPERKMRGPNKNKRKSIASQKSDKSTEDERRSSITSITSTISSNSDASAMDCPSADAMASAAAVAKSTTRPSSSASVHPASHQSPVQTEASRGRSTTVSVGALQHAAEYGASATSIGEQHASGPPGVRQRPPPLNLLDSRQFYSDMLSQYTRGGSELSAAYGDGTMDPHRTPLPNYLAEAYSRIAQSTHGEGSDGMYHEPSAFSAASAESSDMARSAHISSYAPDANAYLQDSPADAMSIYSNPRSNSSDVSAPITPLSLSSDGMNDNPHEFVYPDYASFDPAAHADVQSADHSFAGMQAFGSMEDPFPPKSAPDALSGGMQWDVSMDDETPRASDNDRKLSHAGQLIAQAQEATSSS